MNANTTSFALLFAALCVWGCYPILRRISQASSTSFNVYSFLGEFCVLLSVLAISKEVPSITNANSFHALMILFGGCVTGAGYFVASSALARLPASIGSSVFIGTSIACGTLSSYIFFPFAGSPILLFGGVALIVLSLGLQGWAMHRQSAVVPTNVQEIVPMATVDRVVVVGKTNGKTDAKAVKAVKAVVVPVVVKTKVKTVASSESVGAGKPVASTDTTIIIDVAPVEFANTPNHAGRGCSTIRAPTTNGGWLVVLVVVGIINSSWILFSTVGRVSFSSRSTFVIYLFGRSIVQPFCHMCVQLLSSSKNDGGVVVRLPFWRMLCQTRRMDLVTSVLGGVAIGVGYFCYFEGSSNGFPPSTAYAIGNCAPLFTMVVGSSCMGDLRTFSTSNKCLVFSSAMLFVLALVLLTLSSGM
jgi:drug/metabolite transporter (DMT)-like permease